MSLYRYEALGADGSKQTGVLDAPSLSSAQYKLLARSLRIVNLKEKRRLRDVQVTPAKVKKEEVAALARQLSAFLRAGVPILNAIDTIGAETPSKPLRVALRDIGDRLRGGDSFSNALAAHSRHFPTYFGAIVRSAELTGQLSEALEQIAIYMDRDLNARRKVRSALAYPGVLLVMSFVTVAVLVIFVLPRFEGFFDSFGAELPLTTRIMLQTGDFTGKYWWAVCGLLLALIALGVIFARSEAGKGARDRLVLRIPVVRDVIRYAAIERFCRILGAMIRSGIPMSDGLAAAGEATDNRVFRNALALAREETLKGHGLVRPLQVAGVMPPALLQMVRVGEETGMLDEQLDLAAGYYSTELDVKLNRLTTYFEPAVIVFMGVIVGFVAVALVQAMYGVYNQTDIG